MLSSHALAAAMVMIAGWAPPGASQTATHQHLGAVHFETSCSEAAQFLARH
jgi:hypothetical protein